MPRGIPNPKPPVTTPPVLADEPKPVECPHCHRSMVTRVFMNVEDQMKYEYCTLCTSQVSATPYSDILLPSEAPAEPGATPLIVVEKTSAVGKSTEPLVRLDPLNYYAVRKQEGSVFILKQVRTRLRPVEAMVFAAHIVALADPDGTQFGMVLEAVKHHNKTGE